MCIHYVMLFVCICIVLYYKSDVGGCIVLYCTPNVDVCIICSCMSCVDVHVMMYIMCMCTLLKRRKGTRCFLGVATNLMCVQKENR